MRTMFLKRDELPEPAAQGARANPSFQFLPANQSVNPAGGLPAGAAGTQKTGLNRGKKTRIQNFSYVAPAATSVQLVGCFTRWQEQPINLRKDPGDVWWTAVRLERGTYYYRFLVDGQWRDDPECLVCVPNPFGCLNAVRQVN